MDILMSASLAQPRLPNPFSSVTSSVLFLALLVVAGSRLSKKADKLPHASYGWPIVGNIVHYTQDPISYVRKAAAQHGSIFKVNMVFTSTVWLRGTEWNKIYLETKENIWSFGDGMGLFLNKLVSAGYFDNLKTFVASLSRGINRKVALDHYSHLARDTSQSFFSDCTAKAEISLFEHVSKLVHAIIVQCLMGPDFHEKNGSELYDLLHGVEDDIGNILNFILPDWVPHPAALRLKRTKERIGAIFAERLKEREANPEAWTDAQDYISFTLNDSATAHLSHLYAAHHTLLMFAAHTSTVANISWAIVELLKSPERLNALRQDLISEPNPLSSSYLQAALKETSRLYSGISTLRLARQSVTLPKTDIIIPQGSVVSISPYLTHHDPTIYPNPEHWYPERWLEEPELAKHLNSANQLAYVPFGAGAHRCPGEKLAGIMASIVVGTLVRDFDITWGREKGDMTSLDFSKIGSPWLKGDASVTITSRKA